jgi:hypothetical protein
LDRSIDSIDKTLQANSSPEIRKITHIDEILEGIKAKPESSPEFRKLEEIKAKMKERFEKYKERHQ